MTYPNKPSSAPAIPFNSVGRSKNLNDIVSAIAVEKLLALKTDGTYDDNFSIGDNTLNSLLNEINIRQGSTIKEYDNTGANLLRTLTLGSATTTAQGFRFLDNAIKISNNTTNPLTEIDISPGIMTPDDGTAQVRLTTSLTKSTANDFDNGGLLPNGTVLQTNTMYYVFVIYSTDSNLVNFYADTSKTNPTLPTSPNVYSKKQYRGAFYVDGNGNIVNGNYLYSEDGYEFIYNIPFSEGTFPYTAIHTLRAVKCPINSKVTIYPFPNSLGFSFFGLGYFDSPNQVAIAASVIYSNVKVEEATANFIDRMSGYIEIETNSLSQIRYVWNLTSSASFNLRTKSWKENL